MPDAITRLNPASLPGSTEMGYSQISIVAPGPMAYVSGQVAWHADGRPVPDGLAEQMDLACANARAALTALGAGPQDIALLRCYVTDLTPERLGQLMPGLLSFLDGAEPSLTGVGVAALAAPDLQVEIEMTVRLPG